MTTEPRLLTRFLAVAANIGLAWFLLTRESSLAHGLGWFVAFCAIWPLINWIQAIVRTVYQSSASTTDRIMGISFRKPLGWYLHRENTSSPYLLIHVSTVDGFAPNINYHLDAGAIDAADSLHREIEESRQIEPTLGLCLPNETTVGQISGFQTSTTAFMQGRLLRFVWFALRLPRGVLILTFTMPEGCQNNLLPSFHQFVSSIRPL